ncbi:unnamed protein product [Amoebophrya sp. A25]|nr:unnamed protein product [Amoebophrya sp. A25]|eukprot:GSA25T00006609001.1
MVVSSTFSASLVPPTSGYKQDGQEMNQELVGGGGGGATSSTGPAGNAGPGPRFNPSAWAEQRRERIQKGEELRERNRNRLLASGQLAGSGGGSSSSSLSAAASSSSAFENSGVPVVPQQHMSNSTTASTSNVVSGVDPASINPYAPNVSGPTGTAPSPSTTGTTEQPLPRRTPAPSSGGAGEDGGGPLFDRKYLGTRYEHQNYRYARYNSAEYDSGGSISGQAQMEENSTTKNNAHAGTSTSANSRVDMIIPSSTTNASTPPASNLPPPRKFNSSSSSSALLPPNNSSPPGSASGASRPGRYTLDSPPGGEAAVPAVGGGSGAGDYAGGQSESQDEGTQEVQQAWLGMLRGGNNSHQSEDPLVFGKPVVTTTAAPKRKVGTASSGGGPDGGPASGGPSTSRVRRFGAQPKSGEGENGGPSSRPASGYLSSKLGSAVGVMPDHIKKKIRTRETQRQKGRLSASASTASAGGAGASNNHDSKAVSYTLDEPNPNNNHGAGVNLVSNANALGYNMNINGPGGGAEQEGGATASGRRGAMLCEGDHNGVTPSKETRQGPAQRIRTRPGSQQNGQGAANTLVSSSGGGATTSDPSGGATQLLHQPPPRTNPYLSSGNSGAGTSGSSSLITPGTSSGGGQQHSNIPQPGTTGGAANNSGNNLASGGATSSSNSGPGHNNTSSSAKTSQKEQATTGGEAPLHGGRGYHGSTSSTISTGSGSSSSAGVGSSSVYSGAGGSSSSTTTRTSKNRTRAASGSNMPGRNSQAGGFDTGGMDFGATLYNNNDHGIGGGGNDRDEKSFRQMFDKNTLRIEKGGKLFQAVIEKVRAGALPELAPPTDSLPPYKSNSVKVFVRKRPMFEKDLRKEDFDTVTVHPGHVNIHNCLYQADLKTQFVQHNSFHLDNCFGEHATNDDVYQQAASGLVSHACNGGVATMFMLGQTGSGKTFTMTAIESRAAKQVFEMNKNASNGGRQQKAAIQFLEVRNNRVFDLLHESGEKEVKLREVSSGKYAIQDAYELECSAATELRACMQIGHHRRRTESTDANDTSSRSHALCLIRLESGGKLVLVDCAGTERRKDSMYHTRERQQEGAQINASLHALKECIRHKAEFNRVPTHVYRSSCLTKLLADAFQDNGELCIFCTVSPCATDTEHSITTLRTGFALTGRPGIYTRVHKQEDLEKFVNPDPVKRSVPPQKWDVKGVQAWLHSICGPEASTLLPAGTTGHMLVRMPEQRFVQLFGCARKGRKLYDALRDEIAAAKQY